MKYKKDKESAKDKSMRIAMEHLENMARSSVEPEGEGWFTSTDYAKMTNQAESGSRYKLKKLVTLDVMESVRVGNRKYYRPL